MYKILLLSNPQEGEDKASVPSLYKHRVALGVL